jgi:hypothetical protein
VRPTEGRRIRLRLSWDPFHGLQKGSGLGVPVEAAVEVERASFLETQVVADIAKGGISTMLSVEAIIAKSDRVQA